MPAFAGGTTVLDFDTGGTLRTPTASAVGGWTLLVSEAVQIDGLGFWDEEANGLVDSHEVGLWDSSNGALLTQTTVTSLSEPIPSQSADGQWLFESITALTLSPGTYVLGAFFPADPGSTRDPARVQTATTTIPGVTFGSSRQVPAEMLILPTAATSSTGLFGPNIRAVEPATLLGDYNDDGSVNIADYTVWRDSLGSTSQLAADGDGDLIVDQDDYELWVANYGASSQQVARVAALPEPGSLLSICLGILGLGLRRVRP